MRYIASVEYEGGLFQIPANLAHPIRVRDDWLIENDYLPKGQLRPTSEHSRDYILAEIKKRKF